ncbi:MAG TPA: DUF2157 domain-containing protein, partial [Holophaga sp.]|nr:DUF2157 domain-containing protein [Holophaga sp.]
DTMSPSARFAAALCHVAVFHAVGAFFQARMPRLAMALHGIGTLALGAGIFLAGQIFNLQEHWPTAILLWAAGAWAGFWLLGDWVQGLLAALLTPGWLVGEWTVATQHGWLMAEGSQRILAVGLFSLAIAYLTLRRGDGDSLVHRALGWTGGIALIPCAFGLVFSTFDQGWTEHIALPGRLAALGWSAALGLPLLVALFRRRTRTWMNAVALLWAVLAGSMGDRQWEIYAWCALGAVGLAAWGLHEARRERVNLGVAGFAITVVCFYFSDVMDKLGRSLGLMGLGVLFLLGGWQLERLRRRLNARIAGGAA